MTGGVAPGQDKSRGAIQCLFIPCGMLCRTASLTAACLGLPAGTAACDVKLTGADKTVPNLNGGLDGVYTVTACESGRPLYTRQKSPKNGAQGCCRTAAWRLRWPQPACISLQEHIVRLEDCRCQVPVSMQCLAHFSPTAVFEAPCSVCWRMHMLEQQGGSEHATKGLWRTASTPASADLDQTASAETCCTAVQRTECSGTPPCLGTGTSPTAQHPRM